MLKVSRLHRDYLGLTALRGELEAAVALLTVPPPEQRQIRRRTILLDIGCGRKPYAPLLQSAVGLRHLGVDIVVAPDSRRGSGPDCRADAASLPFSTGSVDIVLTTQLLNFVPDADAVVAEAARALVPGGAIIATGHGLWPVIGDPSPTTTNRWRWTQAGWHALMTGAGLDVVQISHTTGAAACFGQLACVFWDRTVREARLGDSPIAAAGFLMLNLLFETLDMLLLRRSGEFATTNFVAVARKPLRARAASPHA